MARSPKGITHREWFIDREVYADTESFRSAVQQELAMCEWAGERFGVAIVATPVRVQQGSTFHTDAWVFKTATVPAAPSTESEIEALEEALAEPVEAE